MKKKEKLFSGNVKTIIEYVEINLYYTPLSWQEMTAFQKELRDHRRYFNMKMDDMETLFRSQDVKVRKIQEFIFLHAISDRHLKIVIFHIYSAGETAVWRNQSLLPNTIADNTRSQSFKAVLRLHTNPTAAERTANRKCLFCQGLQVKLVCVCVRVLKGLLEG